MKTLANEIVPETGTLLETLEYRKLLTQSLLYKVRYDTFSKTSVILTYTSFFILFFIITDNIKHSFNKCQNRTSIRWTKYKAKFNVWQTRL